MYRWEAQRCEGMESVTCHQGWEMTHRANLISVALSNPFPDLEISVDTGTPQREL